MSKAVLEASTMSVYNTNNIWDTDAWYTLKCGICKSTVVGWADFDTGILGYIHDEDNTDICDFDD